MSEKKSVPAGAKKPEDRKEKKSEPKLVKGMFRMSRDLEYREVDGWEGTINGVDVFIPVEGFNDPRAQEHFTEMRFSGSEEENLRFILVLKLIYGREQYDNLIASTIDPATGRPDDKKYQEFVEETFRIVDPN